MGIALVGSKEKPHKIDRGHEMWLKRQAMQIAAQLPESGPDARQVLAYASELIGGFLAPSGA